MKASDESAHFVEVVGDLRGLVAARVAPVPAAATSLAAGAAHVRPRTFIAGTIVGELPRAVSAVLIGHSMDQFTLDEVSFDPLLLVATAIAGLLLLVGPAVGLFRTHVHADS